MDLNLVAIIGIVILLILMFNGMNIGWAMLLVGFFGYAFVVNFKAALGVLSTVPTTQAGTYALTVIPLFIMMGNFAYASGISSGLYNACDKLLARLPGGLSCATIGASACLAPSAAPLRLPPLPSASSRFPKCANTVMTTPSPAAVFPWAAHWAL